MVAIVDGFDAYGRCKGREAVQGGGDGGERRRRRSLYELLRRARCPFLFSIKASEQPRAHLERPSPLSRRPSNLARILNALPLSQGVRASRGAVRSLEKAN